MCLPWANIKCLVSQEDDGDLKIAPASPKIDRKLAYFCLVQQEKGRTLLSFGEWLL